MHRWPDRLRIVETPCLGHGVAEELTCALARIPGLAVAARASAFAVETEQEDLRLVARRLGVGAVLAQPRPRSGESLGFYGEHPSLTDLDQGDLKMTTDFRSVYATMMKEWLGVDDTKSILKSDFPTLGVFGP